MITFETVIQEGPDGKVRFTVKTPPSAATQREMDVAIELQRLIAEVRTKAFATTIIQPWSGSNDPARQ